MLYAGGQVVSGIGSAPMAPVQEGMPASPPFRDSANTFLTVRAINYEGNRHTKDYIVEREIALQTGKTYTLREFYKKCTLTQEQLMNTALFVTVHINLDTITSDEIDVNIILKERWYIFPLPHFKIIDRNWNVWLNEYKGSFERTEYGAKLLFNNLTGRNDQLNLFAISGYNRQFSAFYFQPYFDEKLRQGYSASFIYSQAREVNYATDSNKQQFFSLPGFARSYLKAEVGYSYRKGSQMRSMARLSYNQEKIDSAIINLNPNFFGKGRTSAEFIDLFLNYQYLNVDYIPYPLKGWMVDLYALQRFSKSVPMFQVGGRLQTTWRFAPKTYLNFQGAFAATLSNNTAFYNQRMLGYRSLGVQGLEYYVVDGDLGVMLRSTLRREVWSFTLKNLIRSKSHSEIPFRIFAKTYGNIAYAQGSNIGNSYMNNTLLRTAGVGIDIMMIYDMVLKLEYSFNQFRQSGFFIRTATDF